LINNNAIYFLQQQLKSIKDELVRRYPMNVSWLSEEKRQKLKNGLKQAKEYVSRTVIEKLERMHPTTPDYSVVYNPFGSDAGLAMAGFYQQDNYDLKNCKESAGQWFINGIAKDQKTRYFWNIWLYWNWKAILKIARYFVFVGPPGIGKQSLGRSIAHCSRKKNMFV